MARSTVTPLRQDPPADPEPKGVVVSDEALSRARTRRQSRDPAVNFQLPRAPHWLKEHGVPEMAADNALTTSLAWTNAAMISTFAEGTTFLGYAELSVLAQRAEYRVMSEEIASEMTREWIEFKSIGDEDKTERIRELTDFMTSIDVRGAFHDGAMYDGLFGRGHVFLDTKEDRPGELKTPLGDGRNRLSRMKVNREHPLCGIKAVEPVWCYPTNYNSNDPLAPDWYRPSNWFVMATEVHVSRLIPLIGRPVPDLLKPAYSFGGLSMTQMAKPYVDNWLRTRQAVANMVLKYSANVYKSPNTMAANLSAGGDLFFRRVDFMNAVRDNNGAIVLGTDEEWLNVSAPLGGLDQLQAQTQEHMAAVSRIPLVKLLGIQPAGLNASSEGEIRAFYDWIKAFQQFLFRAPLQTVVWFCMLSLWDEVDLDITFDFVDLWQLDQAARAALQKTKADTREVDIAAGVITPEEARKAAAMDPDSQYSGLDLDETPAPGPEEPGDPGEEFGLSPNAHEDIARGVASHALSQGEGGFSGDLALDDALVPKSEVGFEHPARGPHHCSECAHFVSPRTCGLVAGAVAPEDWCELFAPRGAADEWNEKDHPRGQPGNAGQFGSGGGGAKSPKISAAKQEKLRLSAREKVEKLTNPVGYYNLVKQEATESFKQNNISLDITYGGAGKPDGLELREWGGTEKVDPETLGKVLKPVWNKLTEANEKATERAVKGIGSFGDKETLEVANIVADHLGLRGDRKINVSHDEYKFTLNDRECFAGGTATRSTGEIVLYPDKLDPAYVAPLAAHEVMHVKWERVFDAYKQERAALDAEERDAIRNNRPDMEKFRPDDAVKPEYKEAVARQFPFYTKIHSLISSIKGLSEDDGITDYSREWWKAWHDGKADTSQAVHETLAEMAKLDWEGSLPRLLWYKESKTWKPLYEAVNDLYPRTAHERAR